MDLVFYQLAALLMTKKSQKIMWVWKDRQTLQQQVLQQIDNALKAGVTGRIMHPSFID